MKNKLKIENMLLKNISFNEFSRLNDYYRLKIRHKPRNKTWVKLIYYPVFIIVSLLLYAVLFFLIESFKDTLRRSKKYSYRTSTNYKKVIKEGVLFDTVEYHEK